MYRIRPLALPSLFRRSTVLHRAFSSVPTPPARGSESGDNSFPSAPGPASVDKPTLSTLQSIAEKVSKDGKLSAQNIEALQKFLDAQIPSRAFATFSDQVEVRDVLDLKMLSGHFKLNDSAGVALSADMVSTLKKIYQRWNLRSEMAKRFIIDLFVLEALGPLVGEDVLTVFAEHTVGRAYKQMYLNGKIDYVIANSETKGATRLRDLQDGTALPAIPLVAIVEAKREQTFGEGIAQTLAEMKAIWNENRHCNPENKFPVGGVLTDGHRWRFFKLDEGGEYYSASTTFAANSLENVGQQADQCILAFLQALLRGSFEKFSVEEEGAGKKQG